MISSNEVKKKAKKLGADLCGITSADRFAEAPHGFQPTDIYPSCKSVIVVAKRLPPAIFESKSRSPYSLVCEVERMRVLDTIAVELSNWLYDYGVDAMPVPSDEPYDYWDNTRKHGRGILSLKHAAELAGLGRIGKNTLLINEKYGNAINLGAVLTDARFPPNRVIEKTYCIEACQKCIDMCPSRALDGTTIDQKRCREHAFYPNSKGQGIIWCSECRSICPRAFGIKSKT